MGWRRWLRYGVQGLAAVAVVSCLFRGGIKDEAIRPRVDEPVAPAAPAAEAAPRPPRTFDITPEVFAQNLGEATWRLLGERVRPQREVRLGYKSDDWTIELGDGASLFAVFTKGDHRLVSTELTVDLRKRGVGEWATLVGINMLVLDPSGSPASRDEVMKSLVKQLNAAELEPTASGGVATYKLDYWEGGKRMRMTATPI